MFIRFTLMSATPKVFQDYLEISMKMEIALIKHLVREKYANFRLDTEQSALKGWCLVDERGGINLLGLAVANNLLYDYV